MEAIYKRKCTNPGKNVTEQLRQLVALERLRNVLLLEGPEETFVRDWNSEKRHLATESGEARKS
jgi:hypothetical protein